MHTRAAFTHRVRSRGPHPCIYLVPQWSPVRVPRQDSPAPSLGSTPPPAPTVHITRIPSPINPSMPCPHGTYRSPLHPRHQQSNLRGRSFLCGSPYPRELSPLAPALDSSESALKRHLFSQAFGSEFVCPLSVHLCSYEAALGLLKGAT